MRIFFDLIRSGHYHIAIGKTKVFLIFRFRSFFSRHKGRRNSSAVYRPYVANEKNFGQSHISVIVPHVNYGRFLPAALDSILSSTLHQIEVIVIESGSDDENLKIVREIDEKNKDSRLRFVYTERNRLGVNRNLGVELAKSNYICSFDPDDLMNRWYLEIVYFHAISRFLDVSGASTLSFDLESKSWILPEIVNSKLLDTQNCVSSHAIFSRAIWEKVGGFKDTNNSEAFLHEDWGFWSAAAKIGARIRNVQGELINIRIHGANMSRNPSLLPDYKQAKVIKGKNSIHETKITKASRKNAIADIRLDSDSLSNFARLIGTSTASPGSKTILVFLPWLDQSGAGKVFSTMVKKLHNKNLKFLLLTTEKLPDHAHALQINGLEHLEIVRILPYDVWQDFVQYLIESRDVKTIWQMGSNWFYDNMEQLALKSINVVDSIFNTKSIHFEKHLKLDKKFQTVIFESNAAASTYSGSGGLNKILIAPNGIDALPPLPENNSSRHIDLLFLGRLSPEKDPYRFLMLAKILLVYLPGLKIVIAGDGPLARGIEQKIAKEKLNISFLGHVEEPRNLLRHTKVLAVTSTPVEGRPNTILEAMAEGAVVVSHEVGSIGTIIQHNQTGYLCDTADISQMLRCIKLLLDDGNLRAVIAEKAHEKVASMHSWDAAVATYTKALIG